VRGNGSDEMKASLHRPTARRLFQSATQCAAAGPPAGSYNH